MFFDAGETLVHPHPSYPELFAAVIARAGHERSPEAVTAASSIVLHRFSEAAADNALWTTSPERSRAFWLSVYERMLTELDLPSDDGLPDRLYGTFTDRANYALFDDVRPVLDDLDASGALLGLVSNFEAWLDDLLADLGIRDLFTVRVISGSEGIEKPDPRIFLAALERGGVDPSEAAYVGDNPEFDVHPPASLGMFPVLIDRRGRHEGFPGVRITDLRDLPEVLA